MTLRPFRRHADGLIFLSVAFAVALGVCGRADGAIVRMRYYTSNADYGQSIFYAGTTPGATEGYGYADGSFLSSPYSDALEIYSMVEGNKLMKDSRPVDTSGWDFYLGVKGTVTCDNSLIFRVTNTENLLGKVFTAYDILHPETKYPIPMDGSILTVPLPDLVEVSGEYAHWRLDLASENTVPEPSTLIIWSLLGALGITVSTWRRRRQR
jgi:hypothetical protein